MDFLSTVKGSMMEGFLPAGWDMAKIAQICAVPPESVLDRQPHWNADFEPVACDTLADFNTMMGHELAMEIRRARDEGRPLYLVLPVGPMGLYRWAVYFLQQWDVDCSHVTTFNMDEWADAEGNTTPAEDKASFQNAMQTAFFGPLGGKGVPESQRNFATKENLPTYAGKIEELKKKGAKSAVVFGVGRVCHIAFWEPFYAAEYASFEEWVKPTHRIGAQLHPLTIEQNALTSFQSSIPLVPCRANTIGPGIFMNTDRVIGGCDGVLGRGLNWQAMSFRMALRYGPDTWVPASYMPTRPGRLFFVKDLAGPLVPETN